MTLYDVDRAIEEWEPVVDEATGEVRNFDELDALQLSREVKLDNIACYILDLEGDGKKIREQELSLAERRKTLENKAKRLRAYLAASLNGQKFATPRVAVTWRSSNAVELETEAFVEWAVKNKKDLLRYKPPEPDKDAIKKLLISGAELPYAKLDKRLNMQIK